MPMSNNYKRKGDEMDLVASHQRLLIGAALRTHSTILELGCGWYSTPILHEIAVTQRRQLITIDNNNDWLTQFKVLENRWHRLQLVGWWGEPWDSETLTAHGSDTRIGLVFIDQGQPAEREYAVRRLLSQGTVDVFVMHDTEEGPAYGYNRILGTRRHSPDVPRKACVEPGMFEYLWTDRCQKAWTTVASNTIDVSKWFSDLPPVETTMEVT